MDNGHTDPLGHATNERLLDDATTSGLLGLVTDAPVDGVPLSYGQRRFWNLANRAPDKSVPTIVRRLRIRGPLDTFAMEWALSSVLMRHEVLRTIFDDSSGDVVQVVPRHWHFRLARADLSLLDAAAQERELSAITRDDATRPFDLDEELLMRARLVKLAHDRHALVVVLHPIAADEGSLPLFWKELGEVYSAFHAGGISLLPEPSVQYADHACWQRTHLRGETLRRLGNYWREHLSGAPALLALPTDRPRPAKQSGRIGWCSILLPRQTFERVQAFGRAQRATPFMAMLAAFKTLLYRYTGHTDIVVGTSIRGRSRPEAKELIGVFENVLALRTDLGGNPTFFELLDRVRETTLGARDHQEFPFDKLVEELAPEADPSYAPICQVFFSLVEKPASVLRIDGLETLVEETPVTRETADLAVTAQVEPAGLRLRAAFAEDIFDAATVENLLGHFATLLESVVRTPERGIGFLPMLTEQGKSLLLANWNATSVDYPKTGCIQTLFEEQVARTPHAVAVVFDDVMLSYAELDRRASALAARLRSRGAGPETLIALCVERSADMVVGLLGILKSGAAYVPLDPAFPKERLAFMLEDSQAGLLVTQQRLRGAFADDVTAISLDADATLSETSGASTTPKNANPDHLAYVLYTSGSTGRPKGGMVTHRNVVNFFAGMDAVVGAEPGVWMAVTSISFDISVLELLWTLTRGFKVVVLADQAGLKQAGKLHAHTGARSMDEQIARHGITHLQCTPSFARLLTRLPETLKALRPLRRLLVGGEALPADLAATLAGAIEGGVINMYGPTETTVWSTSHRVNPRDLRSGVVEIGRPVANTRVYILDANLQPVPPGVHGELYIGGDGVARGYWRRPELTEERFVPNPFSNDATRLYRTGDLARYRADGVIEFLGRADHQVKIRGHRIELGEIEAAIAQHPGVRQNVVVARDDLGNEPRLVAYVVRGESETGVQAVALTTHLRSKLPAHMVPEAIVFLENLPLTPNGKIDRKALPVLEKTSVVSAGVSDAETVPLAGREQAIADIWKEILGVEAPGANDNFFDLGGRSMHVVQMKTRLRETLGRDLAVTEFFQYPTIRTLADHLDEETTHGAGADDFLSKVKDRARLRKQAAATRRQHHETTQA